MRGALLLCMTIATAAFSGCAELVEDPAAAADALPEGTEEAAVQAAEELMDSPGHIAGLVTSAEGEPIAGAVAAIERLELRRVTDGDGSFAFVDLAPGEYLVTVTAEGFLPAEASVDVNPGLFARPDVVLEALPAPEPYFTMYQFSGYADFSTYGLGLWCQCYFEGTLDGEGLSEIVLEAVMRDSSGLSTASAFQWSLDAYSEEEGSYFGGYDASPLRVSIPGDQVAPAATDFYAYFEPESGILPNFGQAFDVYLTAFYHAPAPEGWTATVEEP